MKAVTCADLIEQLARTTTSTLSSVSHGKVVSWLPCHTSIVSVSELEETASRRRSTISRLRIVPCRLTVTTSHRIVESLCHRLFLLQFHGSSSHTSIADTVVTVGTVPKLSDYQVTSVSHVVVVHLLVHRLLSRGGQHAVVMW